MTLTFFIVKRHESTTENPLDHGNKKRSLPAALVSFKNSLVNIRIFLKKALNAIPHVTSDAPTSVKRNYIVEEEEGGGGREGEGRGRRSSSSLYSKSEWLKIIFPSSPHNIHSECDQT